MEFQPPPRRRVWPLVLSGCAVVSVIMIAACAGLLYFGFRQVTGEGEIAVEVDRLFDEIAEGRADEFYRNETAPEFKQATSEKDFLDICRTLNERLGKLQSKTASGYSVSNYNLVNYVDAVYDCQFERGEGTVKTKFKQHNGRWQLLNLNVQSPELLTVDEEKTCPHCGESYEAGAKFCPHCGKELPP